MSNYVVRKRIDGTICIYHKDYSVVVAEFCKGSHVDAEIIGTILEDHSKDNCPECGCDKGHKINCKTGNDKAAKYQKELKKRNSAARKSGAH